MTTLNDALEKLRQQAEADTADTGTDKRRPSWGPALVLNDEILTTLTELDYQLPDKKVARLWATFAGRDRVSRYLRARKSTLPMPEAKVRAFELRLGTDRSGDRLLQLKRGAAGEWQILYATPPKRLPELQLERMRAIEAYRQAQRKVDRYRGCLDAWGTEEEREQARQNLPGAEQVVAEYEAARSRRSQQNDRLYELAKQRVAEFAGDPLAQMIAGAHVTGNCAICGRGLTDPISLERGIGPECYGQIAPGLRAYVERADAEVAA